MVSPVYYLYILNMVNKNVSFFQLLPIYIYCNSFGLVCPCSTWKFQSFFCSNFDFPFLGICIPLNLYSILLDSILSYNVINNYHLCRISSNYLKGPSQGLKIQWGGMQYCGGHNLPHVTVEIGLTDLLALDLLNSIFLIDI